MNPGKRTCRAAAAGGGGFGVSDYILRVSEGSRQVYSCDKVYKSEMRNNRLKP